MLDAEQVTPVTETQRPLGALIEKLQGQFEGLRAAGADLLLKIQLKKRGFERPDRAIAVIRWLEEIGYKGIPSRFSRDKKLRKFKNYQYRASQINCIGRLSQNFEGTEGIEEPTQLLELLDKVLELVSDTNPPDIWHIADVVDYYKTLPHFTRLPEVIHRLDSFPRLSKLPIKDLMVKEYGDGFRSAVVRPGHFDGSQPDILTIALSVSAEDYETFFGPEVFARLNQLVTMIKEVLAASNDNLDTHSFGFLPQDTVHILAIAQDEDYFNLLKDQAREVVGRNVDYHDVLKNIARDIGYRARELPALIKEEPKLLALHKKGISLASVYELEWSAKAKFGGDKAILTDQELQLIADVEQDAEFLEKTSLLKEYGISISFRSLWYAQKVSDAESRQDENTWKSNLSPDLRVLDVSTMDELKRGLVIFDFFDKHSLFKHEYKIDNLCEVLGNNFSLSNLVKADEIFSLEDLKTFLSEPQLVEIIREHTDKEAEVDKSDAVASSSQRMSIYNFSSATVPAYLTLRNAGLASSEDPLTLKTLQEVNKSSDAQNTIRSLRRNPQLLDSLTNYGLTTDLLPYVSNTLLHFMDALQREQLFEEYKAIAALNLRGFMAVGDALGAQISVYGLKLEQEHQAAEQTFIKQVLSNYVGYEPQLTFIMTLYAKEELTKPDVLALPLVAGELLQEPYFGFLREHSKLFPMIIYDQKLVLNLLTSSHLTASYDERMDVGAALSKFYQMESDYSTSLRLTVEDFNVFMGESSGGLEKSSMLNQAVFPEDKLNVDENNWGLVLQKYIKLFTNGVLDNPQTPQQREIAQYFEESDGKNYCLEQFRNKWLQYLEVGDAARFPIDLIILIEVIDLEGGGPLKHIEALGKFIGEFRRAQLDNSSTGTKLTKDSLWTRISDFEKSKLANWSYDDRSHFYNFSTDILKAAPSLYDSFLDGFYDLQGAESQKFNQDIFPLYHAYLSLIQEQPGWLESPNRVKYNPRELVQVRQLLRTFFNAVNEAGENDRNEVFEQHRKELLHYLTERFKQRFGITKIPETYDSEAIRTINNILRYSATIAHPGERKQTLLSWYMALMLNGEWGDFREGKEFAVDEYFSQDHRTREVRELLQKRAQQTPLTPENIGIPSGEMPQFQAILQSEVDHGTVGTIETVDQRLGVVLRSTKELVDEDVYPDQTDREFLQLLQAYGSKRINKVLALSYQEVAKGRQLPEEERELQVAIREIYVQQGQEWNGEAIGILQRQIRPLVEVVKLAEYIEQTELEKQIEALQKVLVPGQEIVNLFRRIGQEFTPTSGALALAQDLDFLENQLVKHANEFTAQEQELLQDYLSLIYKRVEVLDKAYLQLKEKIASLQKSVIGQERPTLELRVLELMQLGESQGAQYIVSTLSNDLNSIIENIRACLGCLQKEVNNDTNLTFGESYRFFMYSKTPNRNSTLADQIVMLLATRRKEEGAEQEQSQSGQIANQELCFVFDRLYGVRTGEVLVNHCLVVLKKYKQLHEEFPTARLGLFMTQPALASCGISQENFMQLLLERAEAANILAGQSLQFSKEKRVVDVPVSPAENHYVEFGGETRVSGNREVDGLVIKL